MENKEKTHWKSLVNSDYLGAYSLQPKEEKILTISKVTRETVKGTGGKKQECTVLHFVEPEKPMILNKVNAKVISRVYATPYIEEWAGKKVQIYAEVVDAFGEQVEALRIRPFVPAVGLPFLTEDMKAFTQAKKHVEDGGSLDNIEKRYQLTPEIKAKLLDVK